MTDRVAHEELLGFRRALLQDIPVALRVRLEDIDHLLGWPPPDPKAAEAVAEAVASVRAEGLEPTALAHELLKAFGGGDMNAVEVVAGLVRHHERQEPRRDVA